MDFPKIRKKARDRAAGGRAGMEGGGSPPAGGAPPPAPAVPPEDDLAGELAARLRGLPAAGERFATWRPGSGEPPPRSAEAPAGERASAREEPAAAARRGALRPVGPARGEPPVPRDPLDGFFYREDEEAPPVPTFGGSVGAAARPEESDGRAEYLTFLLGSEIYAAPIGQVREVLKPLPVTEVPRAPPHVAGIVTVRGEVFAVCDPRRRLELPPAPPDARGARLVVVDAGEGPCALLVDAVADVVRLPRRALEPCPQGIGGAGAELLTGIGRDGDRLFTVLDLAALLRGPAGPARRASGEDRRAGA